MKNKVPQGLLDQSITQISMGIQRLCAPKIVHVAPASHFVEWFKHAHFTYISNMLNAVGNGHWKSGISALQL